MKIRLFLKVKPISLDLIFGNMILEGKNKLMEYLSLKTYVKCRWK